MFVETQPESGGQNEVLMRVTLEVEEKKKAVE